MSAREIVVRIADFGIGGADDMLITVGLGSCVGIVLHDRVARVGGLAHVLLPSPALVRRAENPAKFPQTAVPRLVEMMTGWGADPRRITGRLVGGASMFAGLTPPGVIQMGERNLAASRHALNAGNIPLVAEAVGGDYGRTVRFRVADGRLEVHSVAHGVQVL